MVKYKHLKFCGFLISVKKCPAENVENAYRSPQGSEYIYNTAVTYSCHQAYSHTGGDLVRTCQADKTFNGTAPTCESKFSRKVHVYIHLHNNK